MKISRFVLALCLIAVLNIATSAPPPVEYPQACAGTYCVQVLATIPDQPKTFTIQQDFDTSISKITIDMGRGFVISFKASHAQPSNLHSTTERIWQPIGNTASAWSHLSKSETNESGQYLEINMLNIPPSYDFNHLGISVCVWPLNMSSAGYGDSMQLGKKFCISSLASARARARAGAP